MVCTVGRARDREDAYRMAIMNNPTNPKQWQALAMALTDSERLEEALLAIKEALRLEPGSREALREMGVILLRLGRGSEAAAALEEALDGADGCPCPLTLFELGMAYSSTRSWYQATDALRLAAEGRPDDPDVWAKLGIAYVRSARYHDALEAFGRTLAIDPGFLDDHDEERAAAHKARVQIAQMATPKDIIIH